MHSTVQDSIFICAQRIVSEMNYSNSMKYIFGEGKGMNYSNNLIYRNKNNGVFNHGWCMWGLNGVVASQWKKLNM